MSKNHPYSQILCLSFLLLPQFVRGQVDAGALQQSLEQQLPSSSSLPLPSIGNDAGGIPKQSSVKYSQPAIKAFVLEGAQALPNSEVQAQLKPWLGTPVDFQNLQMACHAIETFYRNNGYRMKAILVPQKIVGGVIKIQVVEEK
ncbi:hypothetical protein G6677_05675 [Polynucleobacter paneuropaeus]|nr:hypothetical protein [Polynucleobacter paneuropaeus]MBT8605946.1 hypothetical protein [Polynucleobacter paneuropaeus]QWD45238.1 hypothetical protein G6661_05900 [Polynucleobacter paneuropaeus]